MNYKRSMDNDQWSIVNDQLQIPEAANKTLDLPCENRYIPSLMQIPPKTSDLMEKWQPPADWLRIQTVDCHTEGEPLRVIVGGWPDLPGDSILAKRRYAREHHDHIRTTLMWEPRGHADMYGCILTESVTPDADFGVLFIHNEGFSTMCGHGIIGVAKVVLELGLLPLVRPETRIRIDTPAGLVTAHAKNDGQHVESVSFQNVPAFVAALDEVVEVPALGNVTYDLAFGGAFYAYVQAEPLDLECTPENFRKLIDAGMAIKNAVMQSRTVEHPFEPELSFLYGTIFVSRPEDKNCHSRHVCIFADGEVDRSPTGTGVSGRLAILHARKQIAAHETVVIESIIGSRFRGRIREVTNFGPYEAVVPQVGGRAFITGRHEFLVDPSDPLHSGFILR